MNKYTGEPEVGAEGIRSEVADGVEGVVGVVVVRVAEDVVERQGQSGEVSLEVLEEGEQFISFSIILLGFIIR